MSDVTDPEPQRGLRGACEELRPPEEASHHVIDKHAHALPDGMMWEKRFENNPLAIIHRPFCQAHLSGHRVGVVSFKRNSAQCKPW